MSIYHIAPKRDWAAAQLKGIYDYDALATHGFIHCSERNQVAATANRFFKRRQDLVLVQIDPDRLDAELKYEEADGDFFPHLCGPLNLEAVTSVAPLLPGDDGTFRFPSE